MVSLPGASAAKSQFLGQGNGEQGGALEELHYNPWSNQAQPRRAPVLKVSVSLKQLRPWPIESTVCRRRCFSATPDGLSLLMKTAAAKNWINNLAIAGTGHAELLA